MLANWLLRHDDVTTWKRYLHYWSYVRGIHRSPVDICHNGPVMLITDASFTGNSDTLLNKGSILQCFCEARRASHSHNPQTTYSSKSTWCVLSTQKSAMYVVVYADRITAQHSIMDIRDWSSSYWQMCYPSWHVECFWPAHAAHNISSASHTSVLPQHPR